MARRRNPATARTLLLAGGAGLLADLVYGFAMSALKRLYSPAQAVMLASAVGGFVGWRVHGDADALIAGAAAGVGLPVAIAAPLVKLLQPDQPLLGTGG